MQTSEISYVATSQFASPLRPTFRSETTNWRQQLAGTYAIVHGRKEPQEPIWISYRSKWRWSPEYCGYSSQCILSFFRLLVEVLRLMNRNFEDSDNYHECWCSTPLAVTDRSLCSFFSWHNFIFVLKYIPYIDIPIITFLSICVEADFSTSSCLWCASLHSFCVHNFESLMLSDSVRFVIMLIILHKIHRVLGHWPLPAL